MASSCAPQRSSSSALGGVIYFVSHVGNKAVGGPPLVGALRCCTLQLVFVFRCRACSSGADAALPVALAFECGASTLPCSPRKGMQ